MAVTPSGADKPARTNREEMYNQIAETRVEELNSELKEGGSAELVPFVPTKLEGADEDEDRDDDVVEEPKHADKNNKKPGAADDGETIYDFLGEDKLDRTKAKIKVDGQEQDVIVADVLRDAQKYKAADKRLEEASIAKRNAEVEAADIRRRAEADAADIRKKAGSRTQAGDDDTNDDDGHKKGSLSTTDAVKSAVSHIYEGDQDRAAEELSEAINAEVERRVGPSGTTNSKALKDQVKNELAWDSALSAFSTDHPDIISERADKDLNTLWESKLAQAAQTSNSYVEALDKAATLYRAVVPASGKGGGKQVTVDDEALQRRANGKREAGRHVASPSTSQRAPNIRQTDVPQTASDVIAEMRKARGQV